MASVTLPTFTPPDGSVPDLLAALIDPQRTLRSVADQFKTSVEALALWMQRPDVAPRLNALSAATAFRARALALDLLPSAIGILRDALDEYADLLRHPRHDPKPHRAQAARRHAADGARRAIGLLSRLARLLPPTTTPAPPQEPPPRARTASSASEKQVGVRAAPATPQAKAAQPHPAPSPASGRGPLGAKRQAGEGAQEDAANAETPSPSVPHAKAVTALEQNSRHQDTSELAHPEICTATSRAHLRELAREPPVTPRGLKSPPCPRPPQPTSLSPAASSTSNPRPRSP